MIAGFSVCISVICLKTYGLISIKLCTKLTLCGADIDFIINYLCVS